MVALDSNVNVHEMECNRMLKDNIILIQFPSRSIPIHYSSLILLFDVGSSYLQLSKTNNISVPREAGESVLFNTAASLNKGCHETYPSSRYTSCGLQTITTDSRLLLGDLVLALKPHPAVSIP
jgi:hypothetical protein